MDMVPESKEFMWCVKLDKSSKSSQWAGRDDGVLEQLVLKRACLGAGAKDGERNLVEVTSFNYQQEKVEACICSLRSGTHEETSLSDLTIFPPAIFKLVQGQGPIHLVGNHMMMDEGEEDSDADQDYFSEEDEELEEEMEMSKDSKKKLTEGKGKEVAGMDDLDDDEDDDDDDLEEDDEEEEEQEEEEKPTPRKRKLANGNSKPGDENKKPKTDSHSPQKSKNQSEPKTPKTPLQQKENKTPASAKKTPAKVYESVDEVRAAIKKYAGGKPRKEDKFGNWIKSAFKVKNEEWIKELWKAHKKELGI